MRNKVSKPQAHTQTTRTSVYENSYTSSQADTKVKFVSKKQKDGTKTHPDVSKAAANHG
jgi:hypothetical protein